MSTQAQVKRYLKPYLAGRPDLVLVGRMIVVPPVDHLIRFVLLDGTSSKDCFAPHISVCPMFDHQARADFSYSDAPDDGSLWWSVEAPGSEERFTRAMENHVLPRFARIRTIEDYVVFAQQERPFAPVFGRSKSELARIEAARGRFEEAAALCEALWERYGHQVSRERSDPLDCLLLDLWPLLKAGNPSAIAEQLRAWERWKAEKLKIAKLWQATPFPFEQNGA